MLDFSKIKTPAAHGDVLMLPDAAGCVAAVRHNDRLFRGWDRPVLGTPLSQWRRQTREALAGTADAPVIVVGHQPAFIHPGVWAKHIVARRLADAMRGVAVNMVVDSDAPGDTTIAVPTEANGVLSVGRVRFAELPHGFAYEQIGLADTDAQVAFETAIRRAFGSRVDNSMLPRFFEGFSRAAATDWVDQAIAGRRAVEAAFDLTVVDHRISRVWCSPLLIDMLQHAETFARSYNQALEQYRQRFRVRGAQRPIPDLHIDADRCELPVWIYRPHEARRRLFVHRAGDTIRLFADGEPVAEAHASALACNEKAAALVDGLDGWLLRPRALTLTLWARLMLADLFVHGIGGAKYDRITDDIITGYYGIEAPRMACVSATLHLDLPAPDERRSHISDAKQRARDLRFNPQRHLTPDATLVPLLDRRRDAVAQAISLKEATPRDHMARLTAFLAIRRANEAMLRARSDALVEVDRAIVAARSMYRQRMIAENREYFFGLYPSQTLEQLIEALPAEGEFRV